MFNLYVTNHKDNEILDFKGHSLGETRQFLLDLYKRDFIIDGLKDDALDTKVRETDIMLYEEMTAEEIVNKTWEFSGKTVTITVD